MLVRPATIADADTTAQIQVVSWQSTYRGIVSDTYVKSLLATLPQRQQRHRERITQGNTIQLVGCDSTGKVVGWLSAGSARDPVLRREGYTGEIYAIYLLPEAQGKGLGTALMNTAFAALVAQGHQNAYVCVLLKNRRAVDFYERRGGIRLYEDTLEIGDAAYPELILGFSLPQAGTGSN